MNSFGNQSQEILVGGSKLGKYRIEKLLGRGGMAHVYLAVDTEAQRLVAIKILTAAMAQDHEAMERFRREAAACAKLVHPNISRIYESGEVDGRFFISMEYVDGIPLDQRLQAGRLPILNAIDIGISIADALEEARQRKIVHRDIKSSNIMIARNGQAKLLDFGLAKQLHPEGQGVSTLTQTGTLIGSAFYLSPEQALGQKVDHRSDIFSLGVLLYEMLAGRLPFQGRTPIELIEAVLRQDPVPVTRYNEEIPDSLSRLVAKMIEKSPAKRYQTSGEVAAELRHIREQFTAAAIAEPKAPDNLKSLTRSAILIAVAIALIIAAIFIL